MSDGAQRSDSTVDRMAKDRTPTHDAGRPHSLPSALKVGRQPRRDSGEPAADDVMALYLSEISRIPLL